MITSEFVFSKRMMLAIGVMPKKVVPAALKGLRKGMFHAEKVTKERFGGSGELKVRSGHLRRSIKSRVEQHGDTVIGWLFTNIIYGRIHELGGIIRPRAGKYLRFKIGEKWITASQVRIPARPYLEPSVKESIDKIKGFIVDSIKKELE